MSIEFGDPTPASGFHFSNGQKSSYSHSNNGNNGSNNNNHNNYDNHGLSRTGEKRINGFRHSFNKSFPRNRLKYSDKDFRHNASHKPVLDRVSPIEDSKIGPLVDRPKQFGFRRVSHKLRPTPRFLINQQPHLKPKKFIQDPWDAANQQKMLQLESSIEDFSEMYETLKKMRDVERKMMENKGLVDKADSAKHLTEAIDFQGTCQDMCPVFERARRNVEYAVYSYEKNHPEDKKAARGKALKVFARPAAAAAPPLPSDVRPPHVLVKSLDYIVENLITTLPDSEGFIWDRMRSIRQDFTYQNYCGPEAIDCNERIVRIHLLIVHIMAKSKAEYSLQQELEQLHKSLITLSEIYDEVRASGGTCPNEAEFRAYALLSKIRDPEYDKTLETLPREIFQDKLVQQAICFRRIVSNSNHVERGIIRTENCLNFYQRFFQLIKTGHVPFLMCSFLELYVNEIRFYAFKALFYSVNKKHKPIPTEYFMNNLAFNNEEELIKFCEYYSIEISSDGIELKTLTYSSHRIPERQPMKQSYLKFVDDMLQGSAFDSIINSGRPNFDTIPEVHNKNALSDVPKDQYEVELGTGEEDERLKSSEIEVEEGKLQHTPSGLPLTAPLSVEQGSPKLTSKETDRKEVSTVPGKLSKAENGTSQYQKFAPVFEAREKRQNLSTPVNQTFNIQGIMGRTQDVSKDQNLDDVGTQILEGQKKKKENKKKNKEKTKNQAASEIAEKIIKEVVYQHIKSTIEKKIETNNGKCMQIDYLSNVLYRAFIHEKIYLIFLNGKAESHYETSIKLKYMKSWIRKFRRVLYIREVERTKKEEIRRVGRQLGVPVYKRPEQFANNSQSDDTFFSFSSLHKKTITFSPVNDEVNKFDEHACKRPNIWKPLSFKQIYFDNITKKLIPPIEPIRADLFIYGQNWNSTCSNWMIKKFGLSNKDTPYQISDERLTMNICCIDGYYDPSLFTNLHLLIFNAGVTDSNIFDLELKLQQDGEELIRLITGISLNSNLCFNLLVVYWESVETPLDKAVVSKFLKLNRIAKSFSGTLENIEIININSYNPHEVLESGLIEMASKYELRLTDRGRYNKNLKEKRTLQEEDSKVLATRSIDERMRSMREAEDKKLRLLQDKRNTYLHLQSHAAASPRLKKRKLPVLLSKNRDNHYKTPPARRTASSSSSAMFSHLAAKLKGSSRCNSFNMAPTTPSHSTNLLITLMDSNETPLNSGENFQQRMAEQQRRSMEDPALFQTPVNSTFGLEAHHGDLDHQVSSTPTVNSPASAAVSQEIPSNLKELKSLIESVKTKVNGSNSTS